MKLRRNILSIAYILPSKISSFKFGQVRSKSCGVVHQGMKIFDGLLASFHIQYWPCHLVTSLLTCLFVGGILSQTSIQCANESYILISTMNIFLVQYLLLWSKNSLNRDLDVSSMFWAVPLFTHDCNFEFGMTKSFKDAIHKLPSISPLSPRQFE